MAAEAVGRRRLPAAARVSVPEPARLAGAAGCRFGCLLGGLAARVRGSGLSGCGAVRCGRLRRLEVRLRLGARRGQLRLEARPRLAGRARDADGCGVGGLRRLGGGRPAALACPAGGVGGGAGLTASCTGGGVSWPRRLLRRLRLVHRDLDGVVLDVVAVQRRDPPHAERRQRVQRGRQEGGHERHVVGAGVGGADGVGHGDPVLSGGRACR